MPMVLVQTSNFLIEVLHELRAIIGEHRLGGSERGSGTLLTRWTEFSFRIGLRIAWPGVGVPQSVLTA